MAATVRMVKKRTHATPRRSRKIPMASDLREVFDRGDWIGESFTKKRVLNHGRRRGFIGRFGKPFYAPIREVLECIKRARAAGVFVPRITRIDYKHQLIEFEKTGTSLYEIVLKKWKRKKSFSPQELKHIALLFRKAARAIGRLNANGVMYYHPHFKNIIVKGNRVGLIDFKFAEILEPKTKKRNKRKTIDWENPESVIKAFGQDFCFIIEGFYELPINIKHADFIKTQIKQFIETIVKQYPCSPEVKRTVLQRLFKVTKL